MSGRAVMTEIFSPEDVPAQVRSGIEQCRGQFFRHEGRIYLMLDRHILSCEDSKEGEELFSCILANRQGRQETPENKTEFLKRILTDKEYIPDPALVKKYRINPDTHGTVMLFRSSVKHDKELIAVFSSMVPLESGDITVPIDHMTVAFIRKTDHSVSDELKEYSEAVIGTMESEGITGIKAGIGCPHRGFDGLRKSFGEADEALSVGMQFHGKDCVFSYTGQTLERILNCIPREKAADILEEYPEIFSPGVYSDEMKDTVDVFFRNDLNLTAASRQLFIHRNTLNYRLDKIRRETGLDLRSFHDAVIFRILSGLPERK